MSEPVIDPLASSWIIAPEPLVAGGDPVLFCPVCRHTYNRFTEPRVESAEPLGFRGSVLIIPFWGECLSEWELLLPFHKGIIFPRVRILKSCGTLRTDRKPAGLPEGLSLDTVRRLAAEAAEIDARRNVSERLRVNWQVIDEEARALGLELEPGSFSHQVSGKLTHAQLEALLKRILKLDTTGKQ